MLNRFSKHIQTKLPYLQGKKLLIAISGGIDSVVLTHLLHQLKFNISLAHCNFQLRGKESDLDEEFVEKLGKKLQAKTLISTFNIDSKSSIQLAAREARYLWFEELVEEKHFDFILTAHHANDNLETFLINLTRGSGIDGFTGIPEKNGNIVRPLLPFTSKEINSFAKENNIDWREDKSNATTKYVRNKIRHKVMPVLEEINPNLLETFSKSIENLKESKQIIRDRIEDISTKITTIDSSTSQEVLKFNITKVQKLSNPKAYLYQLLKEYNFTEFNDIFNLLSAQSGKQIFSNSHVLLKDRDYLILSKRNVSTADKNSFEIIENTPEIKIPIHLKIEENSGKNIATKKTIFVSKELLQFPLIVRKWKNGDYFYPKGMTGKKKLSKYFKDEKYSLLEKEKTWLLCNHNNDIIWIIGKRQDNRFLSKNSQKNLKFTLI